MFQGAVALVTGGASGLGRATVELLCKLGSFVTITDLPTSNGDEIAAKLGASKCIFQPADVTSAKDVQSVIAAIAERCGKLDYVVNCAGMFSIEKVYHSKREVIHDLENFRRTLNVNTVGTFNVIRLAVQLMSRNEPNEDGQRGVIVNVASIDVYDGQIGTVAYSASKAAVAGMTLPLARELARFGIRVCTIAPSLFNTYTTPDIHPTTISTIVANTPFPRRLGKPDEFTDLVIGIIKNTMLNGEVIRLDGGIRLPPGGKLI